MGVGRKGEEILRKPSAVLLSLILCRWSQNGFMWISIYLLFEKRMCEVWCFLRLWLLPSSMCWREGGCGQAAARGKGHVHWGPAHGSFLPHSWWPGLWLGASSVPGLLDNCMVSTQHGICPWDIWEPQESPEVRAVPPGSVGNTDWG